MEAPEIFVFDKSKYMLRGDRASEIGGYRYHS